MSAMDAGAMGRSDERQLEWAAANGRAFYSFNRGDFYRLHARWLRGGRAHCGIILSRQDLSVGEQMRRLLRLIKRLTPDEMQHRIEFLSNWKVWRHSFYRLHCRKNAQRGLGPQPKRSAGMLPAAGGVFSPALASLLSSVASRLQAGAPAKICAGKQDASSWQYKRRKATDYRPLISAFTFPIFNLQRLLS